MIEPFSEKYLKKVIKKLVGKNEIEDALKRLDRLTQEEALMASAQLMETADNIANNVLDVDERVAGVDDRVVCVGDQVAGVDDRVGGVDKRVAGVGDGVDQMKRPWSPNRIRTCRLNHLNRESITTGSSKMALATRSIYESHHRVQHPSQGNGELVFRRKHISGMEINRFRVVTLGSWKTCAPVPFHTT